MGADSSDARSGDAGNGVGLSERAAAIGVIEAQGQRSVTGRIEGVGACNGRYAGVETVCGTVGLTTHDVPVSVEGDATNHPKRRISFKYKSVLALQQRRAGHLQDG